MKNFLLTISVFLLLCASANATPMVWTAGNGHAYELVDSGAISWTDAMANAVAANGYLATITSVEENAFIVSLFTGNNANKPAWLGGTDVAVEGTWAWVTGEVWGYTNWAVGEPNNSINGGRSPSGENHLTFHAGTAISDDWNDAPGFWRYNNGAYVVEYEPVPEPATMLLFGLGLLGLAGVNRRKE